jgi:NAD(P)-dependent dehydrogenase (short-subunit alcohol dehydrogenase family)/acyl carrier protein
MSIHSRLVLQKPLSSFSLYPPLIDSLLQSTAGFSLIDGIESKTGEGASPQVPYFFEKISVYSSCGCEAGLELDGYVSITSRTKDMTTFDCVLVSSKGDKVFEATGASTRRLASSSASEAIAAFDCMEGAWTDAAIDPASDLSRHVGSTLVLGRGSGDEGPEDARLKPTKHMPTIEYKSIESILGTLPQSQGSADAVPSAVSKYGGVVVCVDDFVGATSELSLADDSECASRIDRWLDVLEWAIRSCSGSVLVLSRDCGNTPSSMLSRALCGSVLSAQIENPLLRMSVVCMGDACVGGVGDMISSELCFGDDAEVRYAGGRRQVRVYSKTPREQLLQSPPIGFEMSQGWYVITGGLGGLGLLSAQVLSELGARRIALVSRSGRVSYSDQGLESRLEHLQSIPGVEVVCLQCDVSKELEVAGLFSKLRGTDVTGSGVHGISGIVHSAGVLRDALLRGGGASAGSVDVWRSKAQSAFWLHKHSSGDDIRLFVCYSSIAAALGNAGQSSYASANRYLEELVLHRNESAERDSRPCRSASIQWPAIRGVGMAAAVANAERWTSGMDLSMEDFESVLRSVVLSCCGAGVSADIVDARPVASITTVMPVGILRGLTRDVMGPIGKSFDVARESLIKRENIASTKRSSRQGKHQAPVDDARSFTEAEVRRVVDAVLSTLLGGDDVSEDESLMDNGLDSLGATELASGLSKELGVRVVSTFLFSYPTKKDIVEYLLRLLGISEAKQSTAAAVASGSSSLLPSAGMAIVGVSCRLPGGIDSLESMWEAQRSKKDMTGEVSTRRWDTDAVLARLQWDLGESVDVEKLERIRYGGFLPDSVLNGFRSSLFGISVSEASHMDPGQRLLLEMSHDALVDAGYKLESLRGQRVGVFVGVMRVYRWGKI